MKNIYLIRHGLTDWNKEGRIQGFKESNLTTKGKKQAQAAGNFFKNIPLDIIYSSSLKRAYDTASIINKTKNIDIIKTDLLKEGNFGIWEGKTLEEVLSIDKDNYIKWISVPEKCNIKNGETLDDIRIRTSKFLENIGEGKHENILIVAHSTVLKILMLNILDIPNDYFKNLSLSNTGISKIEVKDYNNVLKYYNSTSHLEGVL